MCLCIQAADRFGVERLKRICEGVMLDSISVENASHLLLAADLHHAKVQYSHLHHNLLECLPLSFMSLK